MTRGRYQQATSNSHTHTHICKTQHSYPNKSQSKVSPVLRVLLCLSFVPFILYQLTLSSFRYSYVSLSFMLVLSVCPCGMCLFCFIQFCFGFDADLLLMSQARQATPTHNPPPACLTTLRHPYWEPSA